MQGHDPRTSDYSGGLILPHSTDSGKADLSAAQSALQPELEALLLAVWGIPNLPELLEAVALQKLHEPLLGADLQVFENYAASPDWPREQHYSAFFKIAGITVNLITLEDEHAVHVVSQLTANIGGTDIEKARTALKDLIGTIRRQSLTTFIVLDNGE